MSLPSFKTEDSQVSRQPTNTGRWHGESAYSKQRTGAANLSTRCPARCGESQSGWSRLLLSLLVFQICSSVLISFVSPIRAQEKVEIGIAVADAAEPQDDSEVRKENNEKYTGGAPLQTNPELEELLRRAKLFADEGQYRNATLLWQRVLVDSGDSLVTSDGETYYSLTTAVEETIARLPEDGLRQYRITADGEARAAMAAAVNEEEGMETVVRQYFLSSFGDDAAFYLGSLALDRYDFLNAQRMFRKIIETYPDPSVPMGQVWLRLAVAASRVGDQTTAQEAIAQAEKNPVGVVDAALDAIVSDIETAPNQLLASESGEQHDWRMKLGRPSRRGAMPALPVNSVESDLANIWSFAFPLDKSALASSANARQAQVMRSRRSNTQANTSSGNPTGELKRMIAAWRKNHWQPVGQILVAEGRVIFKTNNDLVCWDLNQSTETPVWRSLWLNAYRQDDASKTLMAMRQAYGIANSSGGTKPATPLEVMLFGDVIHQSMSIVGDMVISIEGERYSRYGQSPRSEEPNKRGFNWNVMPRRTRTNWMTAYDLNTGKLLWHTPAKSTLRMDRFEEEISEEEAAEMTNSGELGFMAAPIPFGRLLLVPVSDGGSILIQALDADRDGELVWSSYLCDEPAGGSEVWSPVGMALEGRDLYVVCGTGVVFSLDAGTGGIRFARRYARDGEQNQDYARFGRNMSMMKLEGWQEDVIMPYGNSLIVLASDHDKLFALDRQTGEFQWEAPRAPFDDKAQYCMGVVGGKLYCGGPNTVICYDLAGEGRLAWAPRLPGNSYGRGMVTGDGVYMPVENSIVKFDLETGKAVKRVGVSLSGREPVGNLFSDGERIWTYGMNEVHALGNLNQQLALLGRSIEAGDLDALAERATLLFKADRPEEGTADLKRLFETRYRAEGAKSATEEYFAILDSLELFSEQPRAALEWIVGYGADREGGDATQFALDRETLSRNVDAITRSIQALDASIQPADGVMLVQLVEKLELPAVGQAVSSTLSKYPDAIPLPAVRELALGGDTDRIQFALPLLVAAKDTEAETIAANHLSAEVPELKLIASRALINLGNRSGLNGLRQLLDAESIEMRATAWKSLLDATGQTIPFDALAEAEARATQVAVWDRWLSESSEQVKLNVPLPPAQAYFGRILVGSHSTGEVIEYNAQREVVWRKSIPDVQAVWGLPNGNLLLGYYGRQTIVEVDRDGKEVWKKTQLPSRPSSIQRLRNGNTLVVCTQQNGSVLEIDPNGNTVWQFDSPRAPHCARRLQNGNTLISLLNESRVIEVDRNGEVVWDLPNQNNPNGIRRLANGNTLVCLAYQNVVQEFNQNKTRVWNAAVSGQVYDAERLPNGNTILATSQGLIEINRDGKQVWKSELKTMCRSLHAY